MGGEQRQPPQKEQEDRLCLLLLLLLWWLEWADGPQAGCVPLRQRFPSAAVLSLHA